MALKTKTPTAGTVGAGTVIVFPSRKTTPQKIGPAVSGSKSLLVRSTDRVAAYYQMVEAYDHFDHEPSESTYWDMIEAREHLLSLLVGGGNDAA